MGKSARGEVVGGGVQLNCMLPSMPTYLCSNQECGAVGAKLLKKCLNVKQQLVPFHIFCVGWAGV